MLRIEAGSSRNASPSGRASTHVAVALDDAARVAQVADDVGHEERAAIGLGVDQLRERRRELVLRKHHGEVALDVAALEKAEPESPRARRARSARRGCRGTDAGRASCPRAGRSPAPAAASGRSGRPDSSACRSSRRPPNAGRRGTGRKGAAATLRAGARRARASSAPARRPARPRARAPPTPGWTLRARPARTRSARRS